MAKVVAKIGVAVAQIGDKINFTMEKILLLRDVIKSPEYFEAINAEYWLYLPKTTSVNLETECALLEPLEIAPDDDDDASIPDFAKNAAMRDVFPISTIAEIKHNLTAQVPSPTDEQYFKAFVYYYEHDAFVKIR